MTSRAVVAVVIYDGKFLIGKKRSDSRKVLAGEWHFIGENVEEGESDEEALRRGVREEVDIHIVIGKHIAKDRSPTGKDISYYECFAVSDRLNIGGDLEDARWINKNELSRYFSDKIRSFQGEGIRKYLL